MSRTISVSGVPTWLFQYLVAGVAVLFALTFGGQVLGLALGAFGDGLALPATPTGLALFALLWLGLTVLWVRSARGWAGSGSMWGPIPDEQYTGRFAEAGGIARHNWERAIRRLPDPNEDDSDR